MTGKVTNKTLRITLMGASLLALTACVGGGPFDGDFRRFGKGGFDTSAAALNAAAARPTPDARGIISYPGYQVAVARQGDTVSSVAARIGMPAPELAGYNALQPTDVLRAGEVLALPRRVAEGGVAMAGQPGAVDVTAIAGGAINRASGTPPAAGTPPAKPTGTISATPIAAPKPAPAPAPAPQVGAEPIRHKVQRGESAYSIARLYNVNVQGAGRLERPGQRPVGPRGPDAAHSGRRHGWRGRHRQCERAGRRLQDTDPALGQDAAARG